MIPIELRISTHVPDRFSPELKEIIVARVMKICTKNSYLKEEVEKVIELFEAKYPALAICPHCKGEGCNYCEFDGLYNPDDKEPDGTN